jgi:hypothetical protein
MWHAWEGREKCTGFGRKAEGKRQLGRPRRRWEDGIRIGLKKIGWGLWIGFDYIRIWTAEELTKSADRKETKKQSNKQKLLKKSLEM